MTTGVWALSSEAVVLESRRQERGLNVQRSAQKVREALAGQVVELLITAVEDEHDQREESLGQWHARDPAIHF